MLFLGHLGIGYKLSAPFNKGLNLWWLFLGMLLPDLIDKPLYYAVLLLSGRGHTGIISCTHVFGHTGLLLLFLVALAFVFRSKPLAAVVLGMVTHLLIDNLYEHFFYPGASSSFLALVFPLKGWRFADMPFESPRGHLASAAFNPYVVAGEIAGAFLLLWDFVIKKKLERKRRLRHH